MPESLHFQWQNEFSLKTIYPMREGKLRDFLSAQGPATLASGEASTKAAVTLPAGDIDGNDVIDQFDAMTIGMRYNTALPTAADLNNDGIINVLDLEALALNYRMTGPVLWQ